MTPHICDLTQNHFEIWVRKLDWDRLWHFPETKVAAVPPPPSRSFRRLIGRVKWIIGRNFKSFEMTEADSLQNKLLWSLKWVGQLLTIFNVACDSFTAWVLIYTCFYCLRVLGITEPRKLWQIFAIITIQLNVVQEYKKLFYQSW